MKRPLLLLFLFLISLSLMTQRTMAQGNTDVRLMVQPGDSWAALAVRFQVSEPNLHQQNGHINPWRQPAIGSEIVLPETAVEQFGQLVRPSGSLLATAVQHNRAPWEVAQRNSHPSPNHPTFARPIFIPDSATTPRDLPAGISRLEVSALVATPGQAVGIQATTIKAEASATAVLGDNEMDMAQNGRFIVGLTGTGAFFGTQQPTLTIQVAGEPAWAQPWQFRDAPGWVFQQITLTGSAAQIDQQSIADERERLFAIWEQNSEQVQWRTPFQLPIDDYLAISSPFGARRSYNDGPYRTYHEGVDYAAFGGTAVFAPAAGTVVVAELLFVRGNAVIIDHGLGIYSGFYHLSSLTVSQGEVVQIGQQVGEVGTTGLSTGNHLHWDLLVDGVWVDGQAWLEQDMACWILAGLGQSCEGD